MLVEGTVRRASGPWTPSVHALLRHLEASGFTGAPRALGLDSHGREMLSFMPGLTVGASEPWPAWVHSDQALVDVARWLHRYHAAVADFVPPAGALWQGALRAWQPGDVIAHNDAAPYNAVWRAAEEDSAELPGRLFGFIDWDFAGPCPPLWDLGYIAFAWVPLHNRYASPAAIGEGATDRPRRLRLLLDSYGYAGSLEELRDAIRERVADPRDRRWRADQADGRDG